MDHNVIIEPKFKPLSKDLQNEVSEYFTGYHPDGIGQVTPLRNGENGKKYIKYQDAVDDIKDKNTKEGIKQEDLKQDLKDEDLKKNIKYKDVKEDLKLKNDKKGLKDEDLRENIKDKDVKDALKHKDVKKDVNIHPEWSYLMPMTYKKHQQKYFNFQFHRDDVVVMTHPKSGTTWMLEIVWLMTNKLDTNTAKAIPQRVRCPMIEGDSIPSPCRVTDPTITEALIQYNCKNDIINGEEHYLSLCNALKSPRTLKTHLPLYLLNPSLLNTSKVIYVARNPRDVCVSYYHHHRLFKALGFTGDFTKFVDFWCRDLLIQGPYWPHVAQAWTKNEHPNMHFVLYEDLKGDIIGELKKINKFLNTGLTEEELHAVKDFTTFDQMKIRKSTNPTAKGIEIKALKDNESQFIRKGKTGDWKNYFNPKTEHEFQAWLDRWNHMKNKIPFR